LCARLASDALGLSENFRRRFVVWRRSDAQIHAEAGGEKNQRVADVVPVADVGELEAAERAKLFFEREEIGERLTRMKTVGERVDHGDLSAGGHLLQHALLVNASDDSVNPALEVARDVADGFALSEARLRVVQEDDGAAHALNADLEGDASAERGLLKDQREKFAAQSGVVAGGLRLDVRGELQEFARLRGAPFRSGEQIVDEQNRCSERCCWHFFLYFAAERARCGECSDFFGAEDEAAFEVDARTSSNVLRNSRTCA